MNLDYNIVHKINHNNGYYLTGVYIKDDGKDVHLVYGISYEGTNEGLEAYYYTNYRDSSENHYRSYRWLDNEIPKKYLDWYEELRNETIIYDNWVCLTDISNYYG